MSTTIKVSKSLALILDEEEKNWELSLMSR